MILNGYKTYAVVLAALAYAIGGYYAEYLDLQAVVQVVLAALGTAGLRASIK